MLPTAMPSSPSLHATFSGSDEEKAFSYTTSTLDLNDGISIFSYLGYFLSYITAHEVTVGNVVLNQCGFFYCWNRSISRSKAKNACVILNVLNSIRSTDILREAIHTKISIEDFVLEVNVNIILSFIK